MPPITYISAFTRTDAKGGSRGEAMPERENAKIVNAGQKVAQILAFGEFGQRLSHLGKFNTCQWHSACTKSAFGEPTHARPIASELAWRSLNRGLGHSWTSQATSSITNNFATLSLSLSLRYSPTIAYTLLRGAGTRVKIRLSLQTGKGGRSVFISIPQRINNQK